MNELIVDEKPKVDVLKIPLDPIHGGLRVAVFGSFFGAGALGFMASLALIPNAGIIPFVIGAVTAAGTSNGLERVLKDRWPSGRELVADSERIAMTVDKKIKIVLDPHQQVNVLTWKFEIKKEGPRAKKGWYMLALGLKQEDDYIIVYTTASPEDFEKMPLSESFTTLEKSETKKNPSPLASSRGMMKAGEQKRIHDAEIARQIIGGDMLFEQFLATIEFLQANYPKWMITR